MPPSTHYLNLLNLNQPEALQQDDYSAEDISKQLELFTNSNFLDTEPFYHPQFDAPIFDTQLHNQAQQQNLTVDLLQQNQNNNQRQRSLSNAQPRNQRAKFLQQDIPAHLPEQDLTNLDYLHQFTPATYDSPLGSKRSAEEAELSYHETPASSEAGDCKSGRSLDDEDKRRRNTAASARFRVKKKQREQALQESAKAMTDKNNALETRVRELELENKWLRSLLKPVNAEQSQNVLASL